MDCAAKGDDGWRLTAVPAGVADRTGLLLIKAAGELERRGEAALRTLGIDGREFVLLAVLSEDEAPSQAQLATMCSLLPAQLVPLLDDLGGKGLVERQRDDRDRRRSIVRITPEGRALLARADELVRVVELEVVGEVGDELRERLARSVAAAVAAG